MDLVTTQSGSTVQLFAGDFPRVIKPITIVTGAGILTKGTALGKITASGKYNAYAPAAADGTETAKLILAEDVDATSADVNATGYAAGHFNSAAITGLDAAAEVDFEGTAIFIGKIV